jgi:excisionase family DNA binding protein
MTATKVTPPSAVALISMQEVATVLGISVRTVIRLMNAGEFVPVRIGARTLFEADDVAAFVRARKVERRGEDKSP